jgi:hypothetical protein
VYIVGKIDVEMRSRVLVADFWICAGGWRGLLGLSPSEQDIATRDSKKGKLMETIETLRNIK